MKSGNSKEYGKSKEERLLNVLLPYMDNLMDIDYYNCIYFLDNPRYKNDAKLQKKIDKKLKSAINTYAGGAVREKIYLICDSTIWGSAKKGFLLTDSHLYISEKKNNCIDIADLKAENLTFDYSILWLKLNGKDISLYYSSDISKRNQVKKMLEDFREAVMYYRNFKE